MPNRRETLLDAAVQVLGERGMRALTHRAVDAEAGVAAGSTANYFPTRESLLEAIVERVSAMERGHFDKIAAEVCPATPAELGRAMAWFANWLRLIGSGDTDRDVHVLGNYLTGLMLHQLAMPDPGFDPADKITALLESLVQPAGTPVHHDGTEPARSTTS